MSDTPRTDGQEKSWREWPIKGNPITADFARQLETELADKDRRLAEARAEIERVTASYEHNLAVYIANKVKSEAERDKLIEQMREALALILEGAIHDFHYVCQHRDNCLCWGCQKIRVKAALEAAERMKKK